jgi:ribose transport system permease protein
MISAIRRALVTRGAGLAPVWILLSVLLVVFAIASPYFLTALNLGNVLVQAALVGLLAVGLTPLIISGNIDLSVGSITGLSACLAIGLQPAGVPVAIAAALCAGTLLGLVNGLVVEFGGINAFIATLASMLGIRGLAFLYVGNASLEGNSRAFADIALLSLGPIPAFALLFLAAVALLHWLLRKSLFGRDLYAIGGDRAAAVNAGIPARRRVILCFVLSAFMAALCGVAIAARLDAAAPSLGRAYELWAIIAVVLGGASLRGGVGTAAGSFAAVLAIAILRNGLNLTNVSPFLLPAIVGAALIGALLLDKRLHPAPRFGGE